MRRLEHELKSRYTDALPKYLYLPTEYQFAGGGKRVRPMLGFLVASLCGKKPELIYSAALASELAHNFSLIHDDIMDHSPTRRGRETVYSKFGMESAVLAGDGLIAEAYSVLIDGVPREVLHPVLREFTDGGLDMCKGQGLDMELSLSENYDIETYILMATGKTATLIEKCCSISAIICGETGDRLRNIREYGRNLGIAFQIVDDYLDVYGKQDETGKKIGSDLLEHKKNAVICLAHAMRGFVTSHHEQASLYDHDLKTLQEDKELREATRELAHSYTLAAKKSLEIFPNSEHKKILIEFADILEERVV